MGLGTVSIHALLAESDQPDSGANQKHDVSIHALLAESDGPRGGGGRRSHRFNPRPPCGERLFPMTPTALSCCFNPRPPCGERPCPPWMTSCSLTVSIHALLAESDQSHLSYRGGCVRFNPRPPCGERRAPRHPRFPAGRFQSTPSLRRATALHCLWGDREYGRFQSTPSLRRATASTVHVVNQSCKRGFAPTSRRRYITYRLLFIILGCQSAFSNVLQESPTSRQFDVSLGLAQRPCQTALK